MRIIDKKGLCTPEMITLIENQSCVKFELEKFKSLSDIHTKLGVDVIIEDKCPNECPKMLEYAIEQKKEQLKMSSELQDDENRKQCILILEEHLKRLYRICRNIVTLGEYKDNNIYLYIETIKQNGDWEKKLKTTYIHEMFHAYFDRYEHKMVPFYYQVEEALAEAGTLLYLDKTNDNDLLWAIQNIKDKKSVLPEYAYGSDLYEMWCHGNFDLENIVKNYKFILLDTIINSPIDIVKTIYKDFVSQKRYEFERWLIVAKSYSSVTACQYAGVYPYNRIFRDIIMDMQGKATDFYDLDISDINVLKGSFSKNIYTRVLELYKEFLQHQFVLKSLIP